MTFRHVIDKRQWQPRVAAAFFCMIVLELLQ